MSCLPSIGRGENAWKREGPTRKRSQNGQVDERNINDTSENRFRFVQQEMLASVQKHMPQECESSEEEELEPEPILQSLLKDYSEVNKSQAGIEKVHQFLENSLQSDAGICLICIMTIKRVDPIWNCLECYGFFHISCIQKWSKDSVFQRKRAEDELPEFRKTHKISWLCPKCRHEYEENNIPQRYICFCGKVEDPRYQTFLIPHSCGERCDKLLKPECGHSCLLLCHPGPCPPCPKTVLSYCHCKKQGPIMQRCNNKEWSCGLKCGKPLLCKKHSCEALCHSDECPPCSKESVQSCKCGLQKRKQSCMSPDWQCEKICGKPFACGFHDCSVNCHSGSCGDCPRSLKRSCPCGKSEFQLPCTEDVPTCNETCGKLLDCGAHYCSQKCHKGNCGMCLDTVMKVCRCGQKKKELLCQKEFLCMSKCKRMKNCARHPCNRKCCDMNCPPCEKQCGRTLPCGNHKCESICHRGPCYPCREVVDIKCRCGASVISVPCGREKKARPPRCSKLCMCVSKIPLKCHHSSSEPHPCHFGECPPCQQICAKERKTCAHKCSAPCHSAVWKMVTENPCPAGPWEAAQVQMKRINFSCPDCEVPVPVTCLGGHETTEWPCYNAEPKPCSRPCGRILKCGNHLCEKECHQVLGAGDAVHAGENCSECEHECMKERPKGCTHRCPKPCHPGDCPPCMLSLKMKCHCGVVFLYVRCADYFSSIRETKEALLSCGNPCPKDYPCGHRCRTTCHSGSCPDPELCKRKVKLRCKCGNVKKEVTCDVKRSTKVKTVDCVDSCRAKMNEQKKMGELKSEKQKSLKEEKQTKRTEKKLTGKKKRIEETVAEVESYVTPSQVDQQLLNFRFIMVCILIAVVASILFYLIP